MYINNTAQGKPLFYGQMYFGQPDLDPEIFTNQKQVYYIQENGDLVAASQPILLSAGGNPTYNGDAVTLSITGEYSTKVLNKLGVQEYYIARTDSSGDSGSVITYAEDSQTLIAGQQVVDFTGITVAVANIYVGKNSGDRGKLFEGDDYTVTGGSQITLTNSFSAGTKLIAASSELVTRPVQVVDFDTAQLLADSTEAFLVGTTLSTKGRYNVDDFLGSNYLVKAASETAFDILLQNGNYAVFKGYVGLSENAVTMYVDPILGVDSILKGNAAGTSAFKTIQYAVDSMPTVISNKVIQLADGTHKENYLAFGDMIRPSILFNKGKFIAARTQKNGNDLIGGLIIKGNASNPASVIIEPGDNYSYGIYNAQGQLGLQDFHIVTALGSTSINNLLTSHRMDSYVHAVNITCDGRDKAVTSRGIVTESGGQLEFTTTSIQTDIKNCAILVNTNTAGDNIVISGQYTLDTADVGAQVVSNSLVKFVASGLTGQEIKNCSSNAIYVADGGFISFRGNNDSNHMTIDGDVTVINNASMECIWADITGLTSLTQSTLTLNNSDYQDQITVNGGDVFFTNSDSFISPATANTSEKPVLLKDGADTYEEGVNNFVGSTGLSLFSRDTFEQSVSANGEEINIPDELNSVVRVNTGANRTGCTLKAGRYQWQTVEIFSFAGFSVELIDGTTATIATGSSKISGLALADEYRGIKLIWRDSLWHEISRSRAGA